MLPMLSRKVKSFTLSELIVVLIISMIVVGIAFSVLTLVKKQIGKIEKNYHLTTQLSLFEEQLWRDFNTSQEIVFDAAEQNLVMTNGLEQTVYHFESSYVVRNADTLRLQLTIDTIYLDGKSVRDGLTDALKVTAYQDIPQYNFFVYKKNDASLYMNRNGF